MIEKLRERFSKLSLSQKRTIGIILIVLGFLALVTPFSPGSWLIFVGLELFGFRIALWEKIKCKLFKNKTSKVDWQFIIVRIYCSQSQVSIRSWTLYSHVHFSRKKFLRLVQMCRLVIIWMNEKPTSLFDSFNTKERLLKEDSQINEKQKNRPTSESRIRKNSALFYF